MAVSNNTQFWFECRITNAFYTFTQPYTGIMLSAALIALVLSPLIICSNFFIILAIFRKQHLRTSSNVLLVSTAVSDLCVGLLSIPFFVANFFMAFQEQYQCVFYTIQIGFVHYFSLISFLLVLAIAIDRVVAVYKPFFYHDNITAHWQNYVYLTTLIWLALFFMIILVICVPAWFVLLYTEACIFGITTVVSFGAHFSIYFTVKRFNKTSPHASVDSKNRRKMERRNRKERKLTILTFLMLVSIVCCYIPYAVTGILWFLKMDGADWLMSLNMWSYVMVALKSLLNPILYCYSISSISREVKYLTGWSKREDGTTETTSNLRR
ncbi:melanopsin-like [Clytia hemisphaerica]|uniref:melanopsin-like n=1 Tax=Clytia hemisphaerica TaxID=252671 RepID=UPI0034D3E477